MNNTQKMAKLISHLKREMNGAVVDAMRECGIVYPLSYGVSIPTIREITKEYAPDHDLSKLLYRQQIRELQIAAFMIADPRKVTVKELNFWAERVVNTELAEQLAMQLLSRSSVLQEMAVDWAVNENQMLRYTALLALAHSFIGMDAESEARQMDVEKIMRLMPDAMDCESRFVWQGGVNFLSRLVLAKPELKSTVKTVLQEIDKRKPRAARFLRDELEWQIEQ